MGRSGVTSLMSFSLYILGVDFLGNCATVDEGDMRIVTAECEICNGACAYEEFTMVASTNVNKSTYIRGKCVSPEVVTDCSSIRWSGGGFSLILRMCSGSWPDIRISSGLARFHSLHFLLLLLINDSSRAFPP